MSSNLPPLNLDQEVVDYEAYSEKTTLSEKKCNHKEVKFLDGELKCKCGVAWGGPGLDRLYKAIISQ